MQHGKQQAPSDAGSKGQNSYRTNNTTIRWSCKDRLINASKRNCLLNRLLENSLEPNFLNTTQATAQATAWATKQLVNGFIRWTTAWMNYFYDIVISGYQWWCKLSLIVTDSLTMCVVNLSVVAGSSNMHAVSALHKSVGKYWFAIYSKNIFNMT